MYIFIICICNLIYILYVLLLYVSILYQFKANNHNFMCIPYISATDCEITNYVSILYQFKANNHSFMCIPYTSATDCEINNITVCVMRSERRFEPCVM